METWHPRHRALSSHRSDHRGQISALDIGASIWILDVLGTQVEVCGVSSRNVLILHSAEAYCWAPRAWALGETIPAFLV